MVVFEFVLFGYLFEDLLLWFVFYVVVVVVFDVFVDVLKVFDGFVVLVGYLLCGVGSGLGVLVVDGNVNCLIECGVLFIDIFNVVLLIVGGEIVGIYCK